MKLNSTKWNMLQNVVSMISREFDYVTIEETTESFLADDGPVIWGLNWSCCGTQSVAKTKGFINDMNKAIEIVNFLNDCNIEIDWLESFEITDGTKDYWRREMNTLKSAIENQKLDLVWDFVEIETN